MVLLAREAVLSRSHRQRLLGRCGSREAWYDSHEAEASPAFCRSSHPSGLL